MIKTRDVLEKAKKDKVTTIAINYEVVVPLVYNVSALLDFKNRVDIAPR